MLNKDKIIRAEIFDTGGKLIVSTVLLEFPKDFFNIRNTEFVVFKGINIPPVKMGEDVDVVFYYLNGTRIKYATTIDLATDMQVNVHIGSNYTVLEERRRYYKTEINTIGKVTSYKRDDEEVVFEEPIFVRVKNINIGGVFLISNYEFIVGDLLTLSILEETINVKTEIIRIQIDSGGDRAGYGCRFLDVPLTDEEILSRYINKCQLLERDKRKYLSGK